MDFRANEARMDWNDRPIVRVDATVMIRGELGWSPHLGSGFSKVSIYENLIRTEYRLYAYRIHDKVTTLDSRIPINMPFKKASAIFHYWTIADQRMGLAFNGTADARSFDRGVRVALENLDKAAAVNLSCGSSTTSDEQQSASSAGSPIPLGGSPPDVPRPLKPSTSSQNSASSGSLKLPGKPQCYHSLSTLPIQQYRPKTYSSSSWQQHPSASSRPMRRHSSSIPGHAHKAVPPIGSSQSSVKVTAATEKLVVSPQPFIFPPVKDDNLVKEPEKPPSLANDLTTGSRRAITPSRRHRSRHRQDSNTHSGSRSRRTKTPNLDHLERQRDLQPTKPNSYVQIASSKTTSAYRTGNRVSEEFSVKYPNAHYGPPSRTSTAAYRTGNNLFNAMKGYDDYSSADQHAKSLLYRTSPTFCYSDHKCLKQPSLLTKSDYDEKSRRKCKEDLGERSRCRHCQTIFNHDKNRPGSCPEAPRDSFEVCIERISCVSCAGCCLKRCLPSTLSDHMDEMCSCTPQNSTRSCWRRWLLLGIFALFVPCLCVYPLLSACHRCGVLCHCCGGRHEVNVPPKNSPSHALPGRH